MVLMGFQEFQIHQSTFVLSHLSALYNVQGILIKTKPIIEYHIVLLAFDKSSSFVQIDNIICAQA